MRLGNEGLETLDCCFDLKLVELDECDTLLLLGGLQSAPAQGVLVVRQVLLEGTDLGGLGLWLLLCGWLLLLDLFAHC